MADADEWILFFNQPDYMHSALNWNDQTQMIMFSLLDYKLFSKSHHF